MVRLPLGRETGRELGIGTWRVCEWVGIERRGAVSASVSVSVVVCVSMNIVESTVRMYVCVCVYVRVWIVSLRMRMRMRMRMSVAAVAVVVVLAIIRVDRHLTTPRIRRNLQRLTSPPRPPNRKTKPLRVRFAKDAGSERADEVGDCEGEGWLGFTAVFFVLIC